MTSTTGFLAHYDDLQMDLGFSDPNSNGKIAIWFLSQCLSKTFLIFHDFQWFDFLKFHDFPGVCAKHRGRLYHFLWRSLVWPGWHANPLPTVWEVDTLNTKPTWHGLIPLYTRPWIHVILTCVYLNCCSTSLMMVWQSRHMNVPLTSSGWTGCVRTTWPVIRNNVPILAVFMSRTLKMSHGTVSNILHLFWGVNFQISITMKTNYLYYNINR